MSWRAMRCPKCHTVVRVPWFWIFGIEGIFYCGECRQHLKINYRIGALLAGIGWALAFAGVQLIAYATSALTLTLAAIIFLPLAFLFSFLLRRFALKVSLRSKKTK